MNNTPYSPSITLVLRDEPGVHAQRSTPEALARELTELRAALEAAGHAVDTLTAATTVHRDADWLAAAAKATGDLVVLLPATGEFPPLEVARVIQVMQRNGLDLALGVRVIRRDAVPRRFLSVAFKLVRHAVLHDRFRDPDCELRVLRRGVGAQALRADEGSSRYSGLLAVQAGLRVGEVEVRHRPMPARPWGEWPGRAATVLPTWIALGKEVASLAADARHPAIPPPKTPRTP
jgi:hypothetical protein